MSTSRNTGRALVLAALIVLVSVAGALAAPALPRAHVPAGGTPRALAAPSVLFAQRYSDSALPATRHKQKDETPWLLIGGGVAVILLLGGIVVVVLKSQPGEGKPRKSKVQATESQVDSYRLVTLMMQGQTSQVWEVSELSSGRHFALKMLLPEHARSQQQRYFLIHEAEVGRKIVHPKIIKMLNLVKDPVHPYIIMEFFPSTNLKLRLMRKDPYIKEHFREIVDQTATGMAFMHAKGWVHRDLKPDNILVNASAEVRIIDFALAQPLSRKKPSRRRKKAFKAQGTRTYMSPEQIRGEPLDERADVYSFGVTLYELLTFRPPFRAASGEELLTKHLIEAPTSPEVYNPELTREMAELIVRMLSKNREARPRDMNEFQMKFRGTRIFKVPLAKKKAES
jgi:serine/threonine protein kinase